VKLDSKLGKETQKRDDRSGFWRTCRASTQGINAVNPNFLHYVKLASKGWLEIEKRDDRSGFWKACKASTLWINAVNPPAIKAQVGGTHCRAYKVERYLFLISLVIYTDKAI
jgi:hypothetical protein